MATSPAFVPTAEQLHYLETVPQPIHCYPPRIQSLFDAGILTPEKAGRMMLCGQQFTKFKHDSHTWTNPHYCMNSLCQPCEDRKAYVEFHKYCLLAQDCGESFTYLELPITVAKKSLRILAKLGPVLSKVGFRNGRNVHKIMLLCPIQSLPFRVVNKLRQYDYQLHCEAHDRHEFDQQLRRVLRADFPTDLDAILELKAVKRRLTLQGVSRERRSKLLVHSSPSLTTNSTSPDLGEGPEGGPGPLNDAAPNLPNLPKLPKCPHCGKPATHKTSRMMLGAPLGSEKWISLVPEDPPHLC